jgi:Condensation domain
MGFVSVGLRRDALQKWLGEMILDSVPTFVCRLRSTGVLLRSEGNSILATGGTLSSEQNAYIEVNKAKIASFVQALNCMKTNTPPESKPACAKPTLQQELWWHWMGHIEDDAHSMNVPIVAYIQGFTADSVEQSIRKLVDLNDALRMRFRFEQGELLAELNDSSSFKVERENIERDLLGAQIKARISQFGRVAVPANGTWLFRAKIFSLSDDFHAVAFTANHIIADAPSALILRRELDRLLNGQDDKRPSYGFMQYANEQRAWYRAHSSFLKEYWRLWYSEQPILKSPISRTALRWSVGTKSNYSFVLDESATREIKAASQSHHTTLFAFLITIYAQGVSDWLGTHAVPVRVISDGRLSPVLRNVVGLFTTADAFQAKIIPNEDFSSALDRINRELRASMQVRPPTIHAAPPFVGEITDETDVFENKIGVIFNLVSAPGPMRPKAIEVSRGLWPPRCSLDEKKFRPYNASPVDLTLTDMGVLIAGRFSLHDDLLTESEKIMFMRAFFKRLEPFANPDDVRR